MISFFLLKFFLFSSSSCFCPFLSASVCFCLFPLASVCFCLLLSVFVCFCAFLYGIVYFCLVLSVSVCCCLFLSVSLHFCPFLFSVCFCPSGIFFSNGATINTCREIECLRYAESFNPFFVNVTKITTEHKHGLKANKQKLHTNPF